MNVYTGLIDEEVDGIPIVPPDDVNDGERVRPMFELVHQLDSSEDGECWCDCIGPKFSRGGVVCSGEFMRWQPGEPTARFDLFTPPYAREVSRG